MDKLTDRLRGKYRIGPHLPNGEPEFGWNQFEAPPIQHEAATEIERLTIDAVRYQWLRGRDLNTIQLGGVFAGITPENIIINEEDLDQHIDAEIKKAT